MAAPEPTDLREEAEYWTRSIHARFSTPFLRRLAGRLFLPDALAVRRLGEADAVEFVAIPEACSQHELRVYAAVTRQLWSARAVRLEDGTHLINPDRLKKY